MAQLNGNLNARRILTGSLYGGIATGTFNYNELENKPSLNGNVLQGNVTLDIPDKTSELTNDSGFITLSDIPTIPTKTSELLNDSGYITSAAIPDKTSDLTNDSGFITSADIPTATSDLTNDSGFITAAEAPVQSVNGRTGDVTIFVPATTSQITNDSGFITSSDIPVTSVNTLTGDVVLNGSNINYDNNTTVNSKIDAIESSIPTATSDLNNDSGFITSSDIPVTSVNTKTGAVVLDGADIEYTTGVTVNDKIDAVEATIPTDTATIENVSIASFDNGNYNAPVNELIVNIDENVNGYTDVNIYVTSKNLANFTDGWTVEANGHLYTNSNRTATLTPISIKSNINYKVVSVTDTCTFIYSVFNGDTLVRRVAGVANGSILDTSGGDSLYVCGYRADNVAVTSTGDKLMVVVDDSDTSTYEAYITPTVTTISLGQTVTTGGTLNVTTGELNITGGSTVTLTPTEVKTNIAYNNIYSDCGNVKKLTYYKISPLGVYNWVKTQI